MKIRILVIVFLLSFFSQKNYGQLWKRYRYEAIIITGTAWALTDLGGANALGTHYFKDLDIQGTRPIIGLGMRYKIVEKFAVKYRMVFAYLKMSDAYTQWLNRENRGIDVRTPLFETSIQGEWLLNKEKMGRRYTLSHFRGGRNFSILYVNTYLFLGVGGYYFSPQVHTGGVWVPADISNFGRTSRKETYSSTQLVVPFGIGFKYAINRKWKLGLEFGNRKLFTDYLDHHSDVYSVADDSYFFFEINLIKKLRKTRHGLPKF
jgi:hypothetical protein